MNENSDIKRNTNIKTDRDIDTRLTKAIARGTENDIYIYIYNIKRR